MELSNWKFRRALEGMASYPESKPFRVEIERGSKEIDMLLTEPNENPFAKFLSLRVPNVVRQFCRELMLLGNPHVITSLEKLVPSLLKICSYKLDSKDANRGTTYFQAHPSYVKATGEEKEQLKLLGSSLHIICLESVKVWAEWVPVSPNGNESAFKKGYNTLLERGVAFCPDQQYYKKADYEKFSNTYKVEFFDESQNMDEQSQADDSTIPSVEAEILKVQRMRKDLLAMLSQNKPTAPQEFDRFINRLNQFHREEITKMERTIEASSRNEYERKKNLEVLFCEQNWSEAILRNYSLLVDKKINWQEFSAKCINYQDVQASSMPMTVKLPSQQINLQTAFRKPVQPQLPSYNPPPEDSEPINSAYAKLEQANTELKASLKQQKNTYEGIIYQLELDTSKRKQEILQLKQQHTDKEKQIREQCQSRLNNLKLTYSTDPKKDFALQENIQLKEAIRKLNEQLTALKRKKNQAPLQQFMEPSPNEYRKLEEELRTARESCKEHIRQLEETSRQLSRLQIKSRELVDQLQQEKQSKSELTAEVKDLRKGLGVMKELEQQMVVEMKKMESTLEKTLKENINYSDQVNLYKQQLAEIRGKSHQDMRLESQKSEETIYRLKKELEELTRQNNDLRQQHGHAKLQISKLLELQQRTEREVANKELQTPIRPGYVSPPRQLTDRSARTHSNYGEIHNERMLFNTASGTNSRSKSPFGLTNERHQQPAFVQVTGMEQFQQYFTKMPRDCYLRFCRSCLKSKQLLYKENELEIGVISQRMSPSKMRLLLHYTNNSDVPLKDFRAKLYSPRTIKTVVVTDVSSSIEPAEQEKEEVTHEVLEHPVRRVCLELTYDKNGRKEMLSLVLPVLFLKFIEYIDPSRQSPGARTLDTRTCKINPKVLPHTKNIKSYIPQFKEYTPKVFDVDILHRQSSLAFRLQLRQKDDLMQFIASTDQPILTAQQTSLLSEYMSNLQMVLGR